MTDTTRTPYCHKIRYGITGAPTVDESEMDGSHAPGIGLRPSLIELVYSAPRDGKAASVTASVTGEWTRFGKPADGQVTAHFGGNPDGWPAWLAEEARLHDPAASVVVPAADRAALRDRIAETLWATAEHNVIAEWICCDPIDPKHGLCSQGDAALRMLKALIVDDPEAWKPAPLPDAVLSVLPAPADRAAVLEEAAAAVAADTGFHIRYGAAIDYATHYAALLRRMAAEAAAVPAVGVAADTTPALADAVASCPGRELVPNPCRCPCYGCKHHCAAHNPDDVKAADTTGSCAHCGKPVRQVTGTLSAWWVHDPDGHTACHPEHAAASTRAEPGPAVEAQPGKDAETPGVDA